MIINKLVAKIHTTLTYRTKETVSKEAVSFFCLVAPEGGRLGAVRAGSGEVGNLSDSKEFRFKNL